MEKLVMKGDIITPMFSAGGNNRKAEFRLSELKALMRSTFRIASHIVETKELYKKESQLFGDAEHHASPIRLQVTETNWNVQKKPMLLHKTDTRDSMMECLEVGGTYRIVLRKILNQGESIAFYQNWLILSSILGGLGKRSRRARGCITLATEMEPKLHLTKETLLPWIVKQLNSLNTSTASLENLPSPYIIQNGKIRINSNSQIITIWKKHKRPVIEQIYLGKPIINIQSYLRNVDEASHKIKKFYILPQGESFATGHVNKGKFASSLIISVTRTSDGILIPVYTFVKAVDRNRILDEEHEERNQMISYIEEAP